LERVESLICDFCLLQAGVQRDLEDLSSAVEASQKQLATLPAENLSSMLDEIEVCFPY